MPAGRPSDYTPELAAEICERLAEGQSMRTVCRDDGMPSARTLFTWMQRYPEFLQQYARAKEESADALSDEILEISDDGRNDWMEKNGGRDDEGNVRENTYVLNGEHVQRSRLRIDTRKWLASKLKPKKYGDKVEHEHSGRITLESLVAGSLEPSNPPGD